MDRREFICGGSAFGLLAGLTASAGVPARHRSDYEGIQIGAITYSFRSMHGGALDVLRYAVDAGLGTVELMGCDAESFVGLSADQAKDATARKGLLKRRLAVPESKWVELRHRYEDAGVGIRILKFSSIGGRHLSDDECDYYCRVAHALGATAITREIPVGKMQEYPGPDAVPDEKEFGELGQRCAAIADRNGIDIAFHNHLQINHLTYDSKLLGYSKRLKINFDIGHYVAANDDDPLDMVRKYHGRMVSIHVKDRTRTAHGKKNLPFGQGDTPLGGLFALLKKEKWDIPCDIELEYKIPKGSNAVKEVGVSNRYCERLSRVGG